MYSLKKIKKNIKAKVLKKKKPKYFETSNSALPTPMTYPLNKTIPNFSYTVASTGGQIFK